MITDIPGKPLLSKALASFESIEELKELYDKLGPYFIAKTNDVLVNNSATDFAMEFMGHWNDNFDFGRY